MQAKTMSGCVCGENPSLKINQRRVVYGSLLWLPIITLYIFDPEFRWFYTICAVIGIGALAIVFMIYYFVQLKMQHSKACSARYAAVMSQSIFMDKSERAYLKDAEKLIREKKPKNKRTISGK